MQPMNVCSPDIVHLLPLGSLTGFQLWLDARIQRIRKTLFELSCEVYRCVTTFEKEKMLCTQRRGFKRMHNSSSVSQCSAYNVFTTVMFTCESMLKVKMLSCIPDIF